MLICKKEFISAVASTISFSRIQRTQPAAAFLSPLSFLKPFLSSMRKRFLRAMATTKKQATVPQTMPLPFGQLGVTELAGRRPRTPRFLTRGQHVLAPVFYVFPHSCHCICVQVQWHASLPVSFTHRKCSLSRDHQGDHPWQLPRSRLQKKPNLQRRQLRPNLQLQKNR